MIHHGDFYVIYQTQETVFHRDIQTPTREWKIRRAAEYFDEIRGVWITDETLFRVLDSGAPAARRAAKRSPISNPYMGNKRKPMS